MDMNTGKTKLFKGTAIGVAIASLLVLQGCSNDPGFSGTSITAVDGYMIGCTITDSSTPTALVATEVDATNSPGVYEFAPTTPPVGVITSAGCTDLSTGLSIPTLRTPAVPAGQTKVVASPLAALVQAGIDSGKTLAQASADVTTALGLADVDLSTYDPIAEMSAATDPTAAAKIQAAATQVMAIITAIEAAESGTAGAVLTAIAASAATATAGTLDLTDRATLDTIVADSTTDVNIDTTVSGAIADALVAVNTNIETAAATINASSDAAAQLAFLVDTSAASIVVDAMDTEIAAAVGGDTSTLVTETANCDDDIDTASTDGSVDTDGLSSDTVEQCDDGTFAAVGTCPAATGATGAN